MRIISLKLLRQFWLRHPDAETGLRHWYKVALQAEWSNIQDVRAAFPHADAVRVATGDVLTVFNIAGNKYRLIVRIRSDYQLINVRHVLTHRDYNAERWKS